MLSAAASATEAPRYGVLSEASLTRAVDLWVEKFDPVAVIRSKTTVKDIYIEFGDSADPNGVCSFWGRLRDIDRKVLEERLDALAGTVCGNDPRPLKERRADAMVAFGYFGPSLERLTCLCGDPDCPGSGKDPRAGAVNIYVLAGQEPDADARPQPEPGPGPVAPTPEPAGPTPAPQSGPDPSNPAEPAEPDPAEPEPSGEPAEPAAQTPTAPAEPSPASQPRPAATTPAPGVGVGVTLWCDHPGGHARRTHRQRRQSPAHLRGGRVGHRAPVPALDRPDGFRADVRTNLQLPRLQQTRAPLRPRQRE